MEAAATCATCVQYNEPACTSVGKVALIEGLTENVKAFHGFCKPIKFSVYHVHIIKAKFYYLLWLFISIALPTPAGKNNVHNGSIKANKNFCIRKFSWRV